MSGQLLSSIFVFCYAVFLVCVNADTNGTGGVVMLNLTEFIRTGFNEEKQLTTVKESFKQVTETSLEQWYDMKSEDFASFDAVVIIQPREYCFSDFPCGYDPFAHAKTWGKAIDGNVVIMNSADVSEKGFKDLAEKAAEYSVAKASQGKTGLYISLGKTYNCFEPHDTNWLDNAFGTVNSFTMSDYLCQPNFKITLNTSNQALDIDVDSVKDCSGWSNSFFNTYPNFFSPQIELKGYGPYVLTSNENFSGSPNVNSPSSTSVHESPSSPSACQDIPPTNAPTRTFPIEPPTSFGPTKGPSRNISQEPTENHTDYKSDQPTRNPITIPTLEPSKKSFPSTSKTSKAMKQSKQKTPKDVLHHKPKAKKEKKFMKKSKSSKKR